MTNKYVTQTKKIGILRANGVGDFLITLPAIDALRKTYPEAELVLFGRRWHFDFLSDNRTSIDRVIVLPESFFLSKEIFIYSYDDKMGVFFEDMKRERFDIAIHFHGQDIFSNIFLNQMGAKVTVGHEQKGAPPLDRSLSYFYYQSEIFRYLELVQLVGAEPHVLEPEIILFDQDKQEARRILDDNNIRSPFVILHPGSADQRRQWPLSKFAEVGEYYVAKGLYVILSGTIEEEFMLDGLLEMINSKNTRILNSLSLSSLAAVMSFSTLVISNDTGPLHLARAVGCKTVGIFWAPNILNWGPLYRKNHGMAISWELACPKCGVVPNDPYPFEPKTGSCEHLFSFVNDIPADEVIREAERLSGKTS